MMATSGWKVVKQHIPLIKFRKGGISRANVGAAAPSATPGASQEVRSTGPNVNVLPTIEDFQLPPRYQRRPPTDKEIEYINRGGPE